MTQVLAYDVSEEVIMKYFDKIHKTTRIVGFISEKEMLVQRSTPRGQIPIGKKSGLNPIIFKCTGCEKDRADNEIALPGQCLLVDPKTGETIDSDFSIDYRPVYHPTLCPKCTEKTMLKVASRLMCKQCSKQIAWIEAGETGDGKTVKAGRKYHIAKCPKCGGDTKSMKIEEIYGK